MPPAINKQQALTHVLTVLKKHYEPPEPETRPVMEQLLYGVLREGATREQADRAFRALRERFFDWNEIRVSQPQEVSAVIEGLPGACDKGPRIVGILQEVFESTFSFKLDEIDKKGLKNAGKQLGRMLESIQKKSLDGSAKATQQAQDTNDFVIAWVIQQALGGHAIPLDAPALRVLRRLGVAEDVTETTEALRTSVEHVIPKARGPMFNEVIAQLAKDYCWDEEPHCSACPLVKDCPTGQLRKSETRSSRLKPR
jgi:endonuclease-3